MQQKKKLLELLHLEPSSVSKRLYVRFAYQTDEMDRIICTVGRDLKRLPLPLGMLQYLKMTPELKIREIE